MPFPINPTTGELDFPAFERLDLPTKRAVAAELKANGSEAQKKQAGVYFSNKAAVSSARLAQADADVIAAENDYKLTANTAAKRIAASLFGRKK